MNNILFLTTLLFFITPKFSLQANELIASVHYEITPPVEKVDKKSKRTKHRIKGYKKNFKKKKKSLKSLKKIYKPGFIVMIVFGALLILLCIYLILNFALFGSFLGAGAFLVYIGFSLIGLVGIGLFTPGVIFTKIYNSKN